MIPDIWQTYGVQFVVEIIIQWDRELLQFLNYWLGNRVNDLFLGGFAIAGTLYLFIPVAFWYIYSLKKEMFRKNTVLLFLGVFAGACFIALIQGAVPRPAPIMDINLLPYEGKMVIPAFIYEGKVAHSFPSGYAQAAFSVALALIFIDKKNRFYFMLGTFLVCLSLIYMKVNYPMDIFIGGVLGALSKKLVYIIDRIRRRN